MAAAVAGGAGLAMVAFLAIGYAKYERLAAAEHAAAIHAETANADLQDELARLRNRVNLQDQALSATQNRLATLSDEAKNRQQQLAASEQVSSSKAGQLARALEQAQRELHLANAQRATLTARLSKAEADTAQADGRQTQVRTNLDQSEKKFQQLLAERDRAASERDHLRARLAEVERRLSATQTPAPAKPVAEARPVAVAPAPAIAAAAPPAAAPSPVAEAVHPEPPPPAAEPHHVASVAAGAAPARGARGGLSEFERVLGSAGVDVARLFSQFGVNRGEGGPFVPAPHGQSTQASTLTPEKLAALRSLVKSLPVSPPLESYEIGSPFGVRGDPINGHAAYHTGLDFRAPYMSPVYATASGTVTFAGYRADYGKVVEIDHGNGLATRYAHLHRQTVSVGQHVPAHTQIGFLGSTGRATGPHVHYEVLVNGEPQDPEKFIALARLVPVAAQR